MEHEHHLFINLSDEKVWCLPENYEVIDRSMDDIKFNLNPKFSVRDISEIPESALSLTGSEFLPGLVGLNLIKDDSYFNASLHALCAVVPLRDKILLLEKSDDILLASFSDLIKKVNNARSFKGVVSPHEFLQAVSVSSRSEFFTSASDPFKFIEWLIPRLHPTVTSAFRGESSSGSFLTLSIDLPAMPVFKDEAEFIPNILLTDLLAKRFSNGELLTKLPEYLVFRFSRFVKNNFFMEKNSTMVRFALTGLDMTPYSSGGNCKYSLVSTICHEGKADSGEYKAYVLHPVSGQWCECHNLRVKKTLPQTVAQVECYIQIWKRSI
jgi:U4/U6.U5 tri-snRNP-associated protein 2